MDGDGTGQEGFVPSRAEFGDSVDWRARIRPIVRALRTRRRPVRFGSLRSPSPVSQEWGYDRGTPIDRWYIERFLAEHQSDITGSVIEVKDTEYTDRFGCSVRERAVLDVDPANTRATHVADLSDDLSVPRDAFDCFVLTQVLQYVYDLPAVIRNVRRILRPSGVALITVPTVGKLSAPLLTDYWRFTPAGVASLLEQEFGSRAVSVRGTGNLLSQIAFLKGLAAEELTADELEHEDPLFPLIVCARAVRTE